MPEPRFPADLVPRHATELIRALLREFRVVVVNGPRQAGKTTLLRLLLDDTGGRFASLDDPVELDAARSDPASYVADSQQPFYIDEFQRAGDPLLLTIKMSVDNHPTPGRFVLSGSTRFLTVPTLSESLAGRVAIVDLWPLSMAERTERPSRFIERVFADPRDLLHLQADQHTRHEYMRFVCTGGFPSVIQQSSAALRSRWFSGYLRTVAGRDVKDIARIHRLDALPRAMRLLAALTAQELNVADVARHLGLDEETARNYIPLLETVYLIHRLPAWSRNLTRKVVHRSKLHVADSGLAAWLQRQAPDALARAGNPAAGALLETFVVNELMKLVAVSDEEVELLHFRERNGREVDCVLELTDGRVVGIEVKASATVDSSDFKHLAFVRDKLGDDFVAGVVFYTGTRSLSFGDRLVALPVSALWAE